MDLKEFVEQIPYPLFEELRKAVVDRHSREAAEIFSVIELLSSSNELQVELNALQPVEVIKTLHDRTGFSPEVCIRALNRFASIVAAQNKNSNQEEPQDKSG